MLIRVAAFDWNCSQHITPRYSERELAALGQALTPSHPSEGNHHETV
jgi:hypothetical protein